jgi:hypothetical protein
MSGSWERLKYDVDYYQHNLKENEKSINYSINKPKVCDVCRPPHPGYLGDMGVSTSSERPIVDVESDLLNMERNNSNCPSKQYQPKCPEMENCQEGFPCGGGVVAGCYKSQEKSSHLPQCELYPVETRTTHPICNYRSVVWDRTEALCMDPQDRGNWEHPGEVNISYRLVAKDNHRPCIPNLVDPSASLPNGGELSCESIGEVCASFTGDLRPNRWTKNPLE